MPIIGDDKPAKITMLPKNRAKTMIYEPVKNTIRPIIIIDNSFVLRPISIQVNVQHANMFEGDFPFTIFMGLFNIWQVETKSGSYRFSPMLLEKGKRRSGRPVVHIETRDGIKGVMK